MWIFQNEVFGPTINLVKVDGIDEAIATARERIAANVAPLLALEAMAVSLQLPR